MTRARHRKELKCDILKVKRHLGELSDRDFNKMVESPAQAPVDYSAEPSDCDSGNEEWRPHSEIIKRRLTTKRKTQSKKDVTKKPKPVERNNLKRQAKKSKRKTTTNRIVSSRSKEKD